MKYLRLLLFPFSLIYGLVVIIRNWLYDAGLFKSHQFNLPVIVIGNLEVGGAGKSPMTEYLVRLLKSGNKLAILSRGYGRDTKGYILADTSSTATQIGDEPAQFKTKFPDITVAVCEDRVHGINQLLPQHNLIVLDDAYQHRAVKPGLSILLFDYSKITQPHLLLPAGNWREPFSGRWRTNVIIITKCPEGLNEDEQGKLAAFVKPLPYQQLYFTTIAYQNLQDMSSNDVDITLDATTTVFLLTGIANAQPLLHHLEKFTPDIVHHNYPDHHQFSLKNISKLAEDFAACKSQKKAIITTEKDAQRLREQSLQSLVNQLPILVLPIGVHFLNNSGNDFDKTVKEYVSEYTKHHQLH
ncbi:MAG: tetraacyldisaccharide 4'-kinase [Sphingobacteriaceae bacterium]|nr:MAG: tetraacyldisaccharide 4'-kinase [Sphingobacteriaceae bacterium]